MVLHHRKLNPFLAALFVRGYTLKRTIVRGGDKNAADVEKGESDTPAEDAAAEEQEEDEKKSIRDAMGSTKAGSGEAERDDTVTEHTTQGDVTEIKA